MAEKNSSYWKATEAGTYDTALFFLKAAQPGRREELVQRIDRHLGRDLAGRVATHAVRHHVEAIFGHDGEIVLVVGPLAADVGLAGYFDTQEARHALNQCAH